MSDVEPDFTDLERSLVALRRVPPPLETLWSPQGGAQRGRSSRRAHRFLLPVAAAIALLCLTSVGVFAAVQLGAGSLYRQNEDCRPDSCGPGYTVVATSDDSPYSMAFNVIVKGDTSAAHLRDLAGQFASRHKGLRVIVYYFSDATGAEAEGFGLTPSSDTQPAAPPINGDTHWLETIDILSNGTVRVTQH